MWPLLWVFVPVVAHADMSECVNIADQNKKNYCMASYSGSAAFCDTVHANGDHPATRSRLPDTNTA